MQANSKWLDNRGWGRGDVVEMFRKAAKDSAAHLKVWRPKKEAGVTNRELKSL